MNRLTAQQIEQHIQDNDASHDWDDGYYIAASDETLETVSDPGDDLWFYEDFYDESEYFNDGAW